MIYTYFVTFYLLKIAFILINILLSTEENPSTAYVLKITFILIINLLSTKGGILFYTLLSTEDSICIN